MKLARVEINNFRCFEALAIDLHPEVNVFVGTNGAGKTTILDALAIALYDVVGANGGDGQRQRGQQGAALQPSDIRIRPEARDAALGRKDYVQFHAQARDFYSVDGFPDKTPKGEPASLEWTEYILFQAPNRFIYDTRTSERRSSVYRYFQQVWQEIQKSRPEALIPLPVAAYYRARRRLDVMPDLGNVFTAPLGRADAYLHALDAGADFATMCQWLYLRENAELRAKRDAGGRPAEFSDLNAVRLALRSVIEGLDRVYFDGTPPRLMVDLHSQSGERSVLDLGQLSDGYRALIAIVLDFARRLAQAHPAWDRPLEAPGILLIDEIELHLHPRWQQTVIPSLRSAFPNTQLIVATHSPAVLTTVRREHLRLLGADHRFEEIPADVGTFGAESSRVLAEVFGVPVRPPSVETVAQLQRYLDLIEGRQHEGDEAKSLRATLEGALGTSDPDLHRALLRIRQLEVLGRRG